MNIFRNRKKGNRFFTVLFLFLLLIFIAIYTFSQAIQIPLSPLHADKVLKAWNILQKKASFSEWKYNPLELPVWMICCRITGLATVTASLTASVFHMILFCIGLWSLRLDKKLTFVNALIWTAFVGFPGPVWLDALQSSPILFIFELAFILSLAGFLKKRTPGNLLSFLFFCALTFFSLRYQEINVVSGISYHSMFRALQVLFNADFSGQPLFQFATLRYFVKTLLLLLLLGGVFYHIYLFFRKKIKISEMVFIIAILLFLSYGCFTSAETLEEKLLECVMIPYLGGFVAISTWEKSPLKYKKSFRNRVPNGLVLSTCLCLMILSEPGTIVKSRPAGTMDQIISQLNERKLVYGCCEPDAYAQLTVAGKGKINFILDLDDPANTFNIKKISAPDPEIGNEMIVIDEYLILFFENID